MACPHILLFPFMSKGHTIPILQLARLLLRRRITVTIITTPANLPFVRHTLCDTDATIIDLPFPENIPGLPPGIESTDKLPSMSFFFDFATATKLMQPQFEQTLQVLPRVNCIISDGFLGWTQRSAVKFEIPMLVFFGNSSYAMTLIRVASPMVLETQPESDDELFTVTQYPWIRLTRNDFESHFWGTGYLKGAEREFSMEASAAVEKSCGMLLNSFYELEPVFFDYWNRALGSKAWCVGPLCMAEPPRARAQHEADKKPIWVQWLDQKLVQGEAVLYVAFGTQAEISTQQLEQITMGLAQSEVNFLWVVRPNQPDTQLILNNFEERVRDRGILVRQWVNQKEILNHDSVQGFLSHCGWNSVSESICAAVPILAWPMLAEQHLNARMVVEEIKVGLRVKTLNGSVRGFVEAEGLKEMVRELMEAEVGQAVRKKVKEVSEVARKAVEEGGSSWRMLDELIDEFCMKEVRG